MKCTYFACWSLILMTFDVVCQGQDVEPFLVSDLAQRWMPRFRDFQDQVQAFGPQNLGLSAHCTADFMTLIGELTKPNGTWAWTMLDSWGLPEAGTFSGNTVWEGRMVQCKKVKSGLTGSDGKMIRGRYCILMWTMISYWKSQAAVGMCIPSSCTEDDLFEIVQALIIANMTVVPPHFPFWNEEKTLRHCADIPDLKDDAGAIVAISILCFFGLLGISGSMYDIIRQKKSQRRIECFDMTFSGRESADAAGCGQGTSHANSDMTDHQPKDVPVLYLTGDTNPEQSYPGEQAGNQVNITTEADPGQSNQAKDNDNHSEQALCARIVLCFSAYRHMKNLAVIQHAPGSIRSLNGMRVLAMCWIVLGHTWQLGLYITERPTLDNRVDMFTDYMSKYVHTPINSMHLSVETFFLLSALLTTLSFLKKMKKYNSKPPCSVLGYYYFHRYWRITPAYMLLLMFYCNLFLYLGTGPAYPVPSREVEACRYSWWENLLYVNNVVSTAGMCMGWTWYLACDFQYYIVAPVFLFLLYRIPVAGIVVTSLGIAGNIIASVYLHHGVFIRHDTDYFNMVYITPWTRCGSYLIGIILGYVLFYYDFKVKLPKVVRIFGWILCMFAVSTAVYVVHYESSWSATAKVGFYSFQRLIFAVGVGWIMFTCCTGHGGVINSILSWVGWVPLAKLSYTLYLVHPIVVYYTYYSSPVQVYLSYWNMIYYFIGNLMISVGACVFITSFLELPFMHLDKVIFRKVKT